MYNTIYQCDIIFVLPRPKNPKVELKKKKKKKNELKKQYVDYLFNNTSWILWLTEEQNSISKWKKLYFSRRVWCVQYEPKTSTLHWVSARLRDILNCSVSGSKYQHSNLFEQFGPFGQFELFEKFGWFKPFETTKSLITTDRKFEMANQNATSVFINPFSLSSMDFRFWGLVFGAADYESELKTQKFKMADPIWRTKIESYLIRMTFGTRRFLESLITNRRSKKFRNSKWPIQYGW